MSFSLQLQPQTVTVENMTREEHMPVRQTPFDKLCVYAIPPL